MVVLYEARCEPGRHPRLPFNLSLSIGSSPFVPIGSPMEVRPILSTHGLVPGGVSLIRPHRSAPAPPGPLPRPTASVRGRNRPHQEPMRTGSQIRARRGRLPPRIPARSAPKVSRSASLCIEIFVQRSRCPTGGGQGSIDAMEQSDWNREAHPRQKHGDGGREKRRTCERRSLGGTRRDGRCSGAFAERMEAGKRG